MFDHTKSAFRKTVEDFQKLGFFFTVLSNLSYIAYLIYALCTGRSIFFVNLGLLALSFAYFLFYLIATGFGKDLDSKKNVKKHTKRAFSWAKRLMKLYVFAVILYSLSSVSEGATAPYVILMALQLVFFLFQIIFECICHVFKKRFDLFITALSMDVEPFTKPVKSVGNFFKKLSGQEVESTPAPTKTQEVLSKMVKEKREEDARKKQKEKWEKKQRRLEKKQRRVKVKTIKSKELASIGEIDPQKLLEE